MGGHDLRSIADEIRALSPADKFRMVASLLDARKPEVALSIARMATTELGAWLALPETKAVLDAARGKR